MLIGSTKHWELVNLAVILIIIYLCLYFLGQTAEPNFYDLMIKVYTQSTAVQKAKADDRIVMVVIDDDSIEKIGRWPWPRKLYIEMFDYLQNVAKAKVITFDSIIKGPDTWAPESDKYFFSELKNYPSVRMGVEFNKAPHKVSESKPVPALFKKFALTNVDDQRSNKALAYYALNTVPVKPLLENVAGLGSVLTLPDSDKKIRTLSHIYCLNGKYYPSLALSSVLAYFGNSNPKITITRKDVEIFLANNTIKIPIDEEILPEINESDKDNLIATLLDDNKNTKYYYPTWIKWYAPIKHKTISHQIISAYEILEARNSSAPTKINPDLFKDKIVVIGFAATAIKASGTEDFKSTPLFPTQPGVDIQATCIDNVLNSDFMTKVPRRINLYILFGLTALIVILSLASQDIKISSISMSFIAVILIGLLYFVIVMLWLYPNNIIVDFVTPIIYLFVTPLFIYTFQYFIERRKRGQIQNVFSKFVSSEVMDEILKDPDKVNLGGEKAEITILFSDIRGFTTLSEKLSPDEISNILIEYFEEMEPIIKKHKGTLNNYIGDAIMAIFGAPVRHEDHALKAVMAALDMQAKLKELQAKWKKQGNPVFEVGMGINSGYTFLGYVGSKNLMHYTAIGDAVNIASRLEQLNKSFNTKIIISQLTYEKVRQYVDVRALKKEHIRGRTEPVMIYDLISARNPKDLVI